METSRDFNVGDFVLRKENCDLILHRVIKCVDDTVILKGDANWLVDKSCCKKDIVGVAVGVLKKNNQFINLECNYIKNINKKIVELSKSKFSIYINENVHLVKFIGKPTCFNLLWIILSKKLRRIVRKEFVMKTIKGIGASLGKGKGEPLFMQNDISIMDKNKKYILVADYLPPTICSLDENIVGIIVEDGGILSHAACIAREYRIPCIVGVEDATQILKHTSLIEIDGEKGEIYVG